MFEVLVHEIGVVEPGEVDGAELRDELAHLVSILLDFIDVDNPVLFQVVQELSEVLVDDVVQDRWVV